MPGGIPRPGQCYLLPGMGVGLTHITEMPVIFCTNPLIWDNPWARKAAGGRKELGQVGMRGGLWLPWHGWRDSGKGLRTASLGSLIPAKGGGLL